MLPLRIWNSLKITRGSIGAWAGAVALMIGPSSSFPANDAVRMEKTVSGIRVRVSTRTPAQIAAFYEARGFSPAARQLIAKHCFIGVSIRNESGRVVWLEPGRWTITGRSAVGQAQSPLPEGYWRQKWREISLPAAQQTTFKWTQLPTIRDLQPNEPVGGNLTLSPITGKFSLEMTFDTNPDRKGDKLTVRFPGLFCPAGNDQTKR